MDIPLSEQKQGNPVSHSLLHGQITSLQTFEASKTKILDNP